MDDPRARLGLRAAALAVDLAVMATAALVAGGVLGTVMAAGSSGGDGSDPLSGALGFAGGALAGGLAAWLSYSLIEAVSGTSPGKRVVRLHVAMADGTKAPLPRCLLRWAAKYAAPLVLAAGVLSGSEAVAIVGRVTGVVTIAGCALALGVHARALHDFVAGTVVVRSGRMPAAGRQ